MNKNQVENGFLKKTSPLTGSNFVKISIPESKPFLLTTNPMANRDLHKKSDRQKSQNYKSEIITLNKAREFTSRNLKFQQREPLTPQSKMGSKEQKAINEKAEMPLASHQNAKKRSTDNDPFGKIVSVTKNFHAPLLYYPPHSSKRSNILENNKMENDQRLPNQVTSIRSNCLDFKTDLARR